MIKKIKKALGLKTNRELAALLGINESQITRWSKTGFHKSTEALLNLL
ncbi:helix-turn-helix domain-containing protein [Candidatus Pacearchaeota archaeon]|nr:helix-turn-helix domain-containing protein [Candidatus Pacearchaeota archaeon]